jgi:tol-pal system protein YbgF
MKQAGTLLAALLAFGCASTSDVDRLRGQISELQEELANVKRSAAGKDEVQNVNQRNLAQTEMLLRSNATLVTKVDEMNERIQSTQGAVEQVSHRMDQLAQQFTQAQRDIESLRSQPAAQPVAAAPPATEAVAPPTPAASSSEVNVSAASPGPQIAVNERPIDVYNAAYRDYQLANFDLAISGFRDFIAQNGSSDLADNAAYWIGESLFSQKKYREAIEQFDNVVTRYPRSDKVPGALLKKGYAYISLNERAQGIVQLQYVVHEHPSSTEAGLARQRLRALGVETR